MGATTESRVFNVLAASLSPARGGAYDLLVRTDMGLCTLRFAPALAAALLVDPRCDRPLPPQAHRPPHANALAPALRAKYLAAYAEWKTKGGTQRAACRTHALSLGAFQQWIWGHRAEVEAAFNAAPVVKPNGNIL